ncbi:helix-turn-helix domain-containing protein [Dactylosporangium aurantiacum]|uniref:Helix-turn-helix domain-containing protein n=1 Tax=Dactylosporangium aurantiacum TaxID=35754 RepID=A0A9Q9MH08_9ACTN|nr:helix-turn-helix domain-containing protein [Dactylosporangium aurantiacum]MDG6107556.1 helix-turn-helix domain-containing protein [Dactylosporangium aurantiacum]UWZ54340.1 helix-turn-helix domain-containing protein [Dactylosporangium aurantiacum]
MVTAESGYRERPSRIPGATVWRRRAAVSEQVRVLPDGCMDVIHYGGRLLVAGPDTTAQLGMSPVGRTYTAIRFGPGTAPGVLGVPADELRDQRVPLSALWPSARVRRLTEQLDEAAEPAALLETVFARNDKPDESWVRAVVERVRAGLPVARIAADVGLSERQLHRRGLVLFGYGLKTLSRILRVNAALELARGGMPFGAVAASTGYADQAHLSREVRALAGAPLREVIG